MAQSHRRPGLLALPAALALATAAPAQDAEFFLEIPSNTRTEVYLGREPVLLLVCLVGGTRAVIDISSERASRVVLERDECVLVSEREVYATVQQGDGAAEISVRVVR